MNKAGKYQVTWLGIETGLFYQKPAAIVQHLLEHVTSCLRRERCNGLSIAESGRNIGSYNLESFTIDGAHVQCGSWNLVSSGCYRRQNL